MLMSNRVVSCLQASSGSSRSTRQPSESGLVCSLTSARPGPEAAEGPDEDDDDCDPVCTQLSDFSLLNVNKC